jgi:cellobiose phosphorylase
MYRLAVETLLGLERHPDHLKLVPRLPSTAPGHFKVTYRHGGATYHIAVQPAPPGDAPGVVVDGTLRPDGQIPLHDDGRDHVVTVTWN